MYRLSHTFRLQRAVAGPNQISDTDKLHLDGVAFLTLSTQPGSYSNATSDYVGIMRGKNIDFAFVSDSSRVLFLDRCFKTALSFTDEAETGSD